MITVSLTIMNIVNMVIYTMIAMVISVIITVTIFITIVGSSEKRRALQVLSGIVEPGNGFAWCKLLRQKEPLPTPPAPCATCLTSMQMLRKNQKP